MSSTNMLKSINKNDSSIIAEEASIFDEPFEKLVYLT